MNQTLQKIRKIVLVSLLTMLSSWSVAQVNVAPSATASASTCNTGACSTLNDLNFGTCGTQQMWITSSATNPGSSIFIQFTWPTVQVINKMTINVGQNNTRFLGGGTIQIWNGSAWVTHTTFTQSIGVCSYDINFNSVATTQLRIIDMVVIGSQSSNVNFREIQIWQGSLSTDDIGVASIDSPSVFCGGPQNIVARIQNFGTNVVTGFDVNWSLNGVTQTPITSFSTLDTIGGSSPNSTQITLASGYTFATSTPTLIKAWTSGPNSSTDTITINDTASASKIPAMSGNFTINPLGTGTSNFTSFAAAIAAMSVGGVCGPATFIVAPGTYTSQVVIPNIQGASHINTITFDGVNPDSCIISGSFSAQGTVIFNASKYVTFRNFRVINTASGNSTGIAVVGAYNKISLINNRVFVPIQSSTSSQGFGILGTGTANGAGGSAHPGDSLLIDSNEVTGGGYGIYILGSANSTSNSGIELLNNKVISSNYMGVYLNAIRNPINVINNEINVLGLNYGYYALWFGVNSHSNTTIGHKIIGNQVRGWSYCGIYITTSMLSSTAAPTKIYNNVSEGLASGYTLNQYGIYLTSAANCIVEVYHNTVVTNSSSTSTIASAFYNTGSTNLLIKNNIFYYAGGAGAPLYCNTAIVGNRINYNIYFNGANPTTGNAVRNSGALWNSSNFNTPARGGDSSFFVNPSFINRLPTPGNLALADGCDGYGVNLSSDIPLDINGNLRAITPNIGAYEFAGGSSNNLRVTALLTPAIPVTAGTQDLRFLVKNIGSNTITSYNASYKHGTSTAVSIPRTVSMGVCATDTATFTGLNQVTIGAVNHLLMYTDGPNASTDADPSNDSLRVSLFTPLNGTYTVGGTSPDFPSVIAAAAGLQFGVSGPVTFDIRPGTYTGQVVVNGPIIGASDSSRVTFEGNSNLNRIITNGSVGPVFLINQASFVTVQNLKIINTAASGQFSGVGVVGSNANSNASKVWVRKNVIEVPVLSGTSSNGYGIIFTGTVGATGIAAMRMDSSLIDSNSITGGGYGIAFYGATNALYNRGTVIRGNKIMKANYMGAYILYNYNPIDFIGNEVNVQGQNYGYYGVYFLANNSSHPTIPSRFNNNIITGFSYAGGWITTPVSVSTAAPFEFYNNMFNSIPDGYTLTQYSAYLTLPANAVAKIYHNTSIVNTGNTSTASSAFYVTGSANAEVKNNIFAYYAGSGVPFYTVTAITGNKVNYNNYFNGANLTTGNLLFNGGNWNASNFLNSSRGGDTSFNYAPIFANRLPMPGDLRLTSACAQRGFDLSMDVPRDIDNQLRSIPPQIGADENASGAVDMAMDFIHSPSFPIDSGYQDVVLRVRNNGSTVITSFDISYKMNNGTPVTQAWFGSLNPCDTAMVTFTGLQQLYVPYNVNNSLKVYTGNPNAGADGNNLNDTMVVDLATPLSGNYIIGSGVADFPNFTSAVNALTLRGVSDAVTFNVRTGVYNESVFIDNVIGASANNNITFKSMANNRDSVELAFNSVSGNNFVLSFGTNSQYITFKDITIRQLYNAGTATTYIVRYNGNASYDSLINCNVLHPYVNFSVTGYGYSVYGTGLTGIGNGFKNNLFRGTYYGFYWFGNSASQVRYTTFEGNTFDSAYYASLYYIYYSNFTTFKNNNVNMVNLGNGTSYSYFYYLDSTTIFTGNKFTYTIPNYLYTYFFRHNGLSPRSLFANNTFVGPAFYHGFGNTVQNLDFLNNSYSTGSQYFYVGNSGFSNVKFRNNIWMSGTANSCYWSAVPVSPSINTDYNNFWSTSSATAIYATSSRNLTDFRLANPSQERHSVQANPGFTSATNLVPNPASADVWNTNGRGEIQAEVPADINNVARPATISDGVPDLGAYEVSPTSIPNNCVISPATPVAGGTQVILSGLDTVMTIDWDAFTTAPTSISAKLYTGVKAPLLGTATGYTNFYVELDAPSGFYNYYARLYYNPSWIGTVPSESVLKMSKKAPTSSWLNLLSTSSTVDSTLKSIMANSPLSELPAYFTGTDDNNPLPVALVTFSGVKSDVAADLNWATSTEINSSHFEVERSIDGRSFRAIGKVKSSQNSSTLKNYVFSDESAFANNETVVYYRLKMVDLDGTFEYSSVISISSEEVEETVTVFPNPFNNDLFINYKATTDEVVELRDMSGRVVFSQVLNGQEMVHQLSIPSTLDKGVYFLTFGSGKAKAVKVIRN